MTADFRPRAVALAALAAVALAAAGCGGDDAETSGAQRLAAPGSTWAQLSGDEQVQALQACRLKAAVAAATDGGIRTVPYYTARYDAVAEVDGTDLHEALDAYFAEAGHATTTIGDGCTRVLAGLTDLPPVQAGPLADFAAPVDARRPELRLDVTKPDVRLDVRLTPADGRLTLGPAPGRAVSTAKVQVVPHGDGTATVTLRSLPAGVSYLQAHVAAGDRTWDRLLVVDRDERAERSAPTFAPMTLRGERSRGLRVLDLPVPARVTVDAPQAPLTLATGDALLLAHAPGDRTAQVIPAGRYRNLQIATSGPWTMTIAPA